MTSIERAVPLTDDRLSDEDVVSRVCDGDVGLFELLMRRHNQRIYRTVRAILRGDEGVEDVMQQAYLNAYQHLRQFAGGAKFSTWLTRIAVNEALGRRRRERGGGGDSVTLNLIEANLPDPEQQATTSELRDILEREISALPEAFRTVMMMREVEGMTTGETADALGISEDLVKTRLHRARTMLRDRLYARAGVTLDSLFTFGSTRCDRLVEAVMERIRFPEK